MRRQPSSSSNHEKESAPRMLHWRIETGHRHRSSLQAAIQPHRCKGHPGPVNSHPSKCLDGQCQMTQSKHPASDFTVRGREHVKLLLVSATGSLREGICAQDRLVLYRGQLAP